MIKAKEFAPHAVILDIGLPGISGYQVAKELRMIQGIENVRIIALSGYGREKDKLLASEAGFDYHLVKPADMKTINALLKADVIKFDQKF